MSLNLLTILSILILYVLIKATVPVFLLAIVKSLRYFNLILSKTTYKIFANVSISRGISWRNSRVISVSAIPMSLSLSGQICLRSWLRLFRCTNVTGASRKRVNEQRNWGEGWMVTLRGLKASEFLNAGTKPGGNVQKYFVLIRSI